MFLKNKIFLFVFILFLTDCISFLLSFVTAFYCRFYFFAVFFSSTNTYQFFESLKYSLWLSLIWIFFINFFAGYKLFYIPKIDLFIKILKASSAFVIFLLALIFITKNDYSRMLIVFMWFNLLVFTFLFRYILKKLIAYVVRKKNIRNNILVIGKKVRKYKKIFNNSYINKVFYYPYMLDDKNVEKLKLLSLKKQIKEIVLVNYLIKDNDFLLLCEWADKENIDIKIFPTEAQMPRDKVVLDDTLGIPIIFINSTPTDDFDYFLKRIFDVVVSFSLLVILFPIFCLIAIIIKLESKGPIFYKHLRIGYNQKNFYCYKFRSMYDNADKHLQSLTENTLEHNEAFLKLEDDERVTKFGKFIRKYSIDEFPQLVNVLKGEMSLVGPRPIVNWEFEQIKKVYTRYSYRKMFKVLPGITGLWQVSGRSMLSDEKRLELDIYYVNNWCLNLDIKILIKTVFVVLLHKGAY